MQGYHGGGQAGAQNRGDSDHHAASRGDSSDTDTATCRDQPGQKDDKAAKR